MDYEKIFATLQLLVPLLGLNTPTAVGAMIGSGIAFLAGRNHVGIIRRFINAISGCVFAIYGADGFVELTRLFVTVNPTDAMMRLLGMVMGLQGILLCEFFINFTKRLSENGDDFADALLGGFKGAIGSLVDRIKGNPPVATALPPNEPSGNDPQPIGGP